MDDTTIKSIDTSRPSDFRYKAVTSEIRYQEMIAEKVVEEIEVKEEPKEPIDVDSDESRPVSVEPKELREMEDDMSDVFQPEGKIRIQFFNAVHNTTAFQESEEPVVSQRWLCLLSEKEIRAEEARRKTRHTSVKKAPIRETLDIYLDKFSRCVEGYERIVLCRQK